MYVLGISAFFHDSAAALVRDGEIVAAAQEERFTRVKHDPGFPGRAIDACLAHAGIELAAVERVAYYESTRLKRRRQIETMLATVPSGRRQALRVLRTQIDVAQRPARRLVDELSTRAPSVDWRERLTSSEHHLSHAAAAFYPSPFERAAILTVDAVGERATTTLGVGERERIDLVEELRFPHSLGMLYSAFTQYLGFKVNSGEYKVMGLAPYGTARYCDVILSELVDVRADGSFRLNMDYFEFTRGLTMTGTRFHELFGGPPRRAETPIVQRHMDLAASIQRATELVLVRMVRHLHALTGERALCLAGGVALNCVANSVIARTGPFESMWVQPASGDAGSALGAALSASYAAGADRVLPVTGDSMRGARLGPSYSQPDVEQRLRAAGARFDVRSDREVIDATVAALDAGCVVGWFQGRMEFGPRSLGSRSILADPRRADMQRLLNMKIKFRESFRPFAPAVLLEEAEEWFDLDGPSPYMLFVADVGAAHRRPIPDSHRALRGFDRLEIARSNIPAVTHVDGSARVQTVDRETDPKFHRLIERFAERTGCPVVVNTSFNVRGEPIVCTPEDAFRCFMGTGMDLLVIENCVVEKSDQHHPVVVDHHRSFAAD